MLGAALDEEELDLRYRTHARRVRFALYCGGRPGEIRTLRWSSVIFADGHPSHIQLSKSKTGPRRIELNDLAIGILNAIGRGANRSLVFPSHINPGKPSSEQAAAAFWCRVAGKAGLPKESQQYWLRHTFGSNAILDGATVMETCAMLGHTKPSTTRRYIHVPTKTTIEAGNRIGTRIASWMGLPRGLPAAKVGEGLARHHR